MYSPPPQFSINVDTYGRPVLQRQGPCIVVRRAGAVQRKGEEGIYYLDLPGGRAGSQRGASLKGSNAYWCGLSRDAIEIQYGWAGRRRLFGVGMT